MLSFALFSGALVLCAPVVVLFMSHPAQVASSVVSLVFIDMVDFWLAFWIRHKH